MKPFPCFLLLMVLSFSKCAGGYSIITGANGYIGRAIAHELSTNKQECAYCLVRPHRVESEQAYWKDDACVLPYDMLDGGSSMCQALQRIQNDAGEEPEAITVYHVASSFGPTEDHQQTALDNVRGTMDLIKALASSSKNCRLILTSSMAAVRGTGQEPGNGKYYTNKDWNTCSHLYSDNWGSSYQWSKMESERRAWELCEQHDIPMSSICPSFVFGPAPTYSEQTSFSLHLVGNWLNGTSPVQSRLFVDVRDVARAHVLAASRPMGQRFLVSSERRVPSKEIAQWLKDVKSVCGANTERIHYDSKFTGGAIAIGDKEVEAEDRLRDELGLELRPVRDTIIDMAKMLLEEKSDERV